jgi:phospholipid/cholesterol/gamma-HCH transport system ATP-binding protein
MKDVPKLAWKGVSKRFDGAPVLDGLDLSVAAGRSLVIIGGSGQGKSVMLKVALGLIPPDGGEVALDGHDLLGVGGAAQARLFSRIGVLFQGAALFDSLTVWENVAFRLVNADRVKRSQARAMAIEALDAVRLGREVADLFPSELSGGMQKRVALSRAVVAHPEILFFDEPTTGLDPINAAAIDQLILGQVRRLGCTAVSITHDLASARAIADDIAMLHGGRIVWRGGPDELDTTDNPYLRQFVDAQPDGPMNLEG